MTTSSSKKKKKNVTVIEEERPFLEAQVMARSYDTADNDEHDGNTTAAAAAARSNQPHFRGPSNLSTSSEFDDAVDDFETPTMLENIPLPPATPHVSSLDFERIINQYSIQAVRDQFLLPPLPTDGSSVSSQRKRASNTNQNKDDDGRRRRKTHIFRQRPMHRKVFGYTGRTATRWFLSVFAGFLTGVASIVIVEISGGLVQWRSHNLQSLIIDPRYSDRTVLIIYLFLNVVAALMAAELCVNWVPQAAGSGISQVKAYLNGIRGNQKFTRLNLLVVKIVGNILAVSSSLAVGQEGPLIHIGAIMGSGCSKISGGMSKFLDKYQECTGRACTDDLHCRGCGGQRASNNSYRPTVAQRLLTWTGTQLSHFATDAERRDLVSIGASCGFAASFGAPVGGLLFVLDDISSYFSRNLLLRILVANAVGTFCLALHHHDLSNYSVISLGTYSEKHDELFINRIEEIPLYILMGILGGILGGLFCKCFMFLRRVITTKVYPPPGPNRAKWQLLEVAIVSIITSLVIFYLPTMRWACKARPADYGMEPTDIDYREQATELGYHGEPYKARFFCPEGEINELANILFGSRIVAIRRILVNPEQFQWQTLVTVGVVFYVLMTITFGIAIPSGIFTPTVLIGAALGGATGMFFQNYFDPSITPSTFALLGVAALLAGIQRSTISVAVILVEGTGQIRILTPAIITVCVARYVASLIYAKGVFEAVMESKKTPYLEAQEHKRQYDAIEVGDIMSDGPVVTVNPRERVKDLVHLMDSNIYNGYPVIDPDTKKYLGLIRRDQICALLECGVFDSSHSNHSNDVAGGPMWTRPQAGVEKTPLMRWAYHINDDRYEYVLQSSSVRSQQDTRNAVSPAPRFSVVSSPNLRLSSFSALPKEFATISKNRDGNLYVSWLNESIEYNWLNLGAVMNRGTSTVTEFCPVSKAYNLFTAMGLRHIVVLGGKSGGEVVGMVTRQDLLPDVIREKTGV